MERYRNNEGFQIPARMNGIAAQVLLALVCLFGVVREAKAQEVEWPLPGRAPDLLVGVEYGLNAFDRFYAAMHQGTIYGAVRNEDGALFAKIIRGKRFGLTGMQGEIEAYPIIADKTYGYVSYAYGETPVYPRHRMAAELYRGLPGGFEGSLGARYYMFPADESVFLATGSVSYYWGRFLFTVKPFVSLNLSRTAASVVLSSRYYLSDNEEYLTARIGAGFNPDERWVQTSQGVPGRETSLLHSQTIGAAFQMIIMRKVMFLTNLDATRQEVVFKSGTYVFDLAVGCGIRVML